MLTSLLDELVSVLLDGALNRFPQFLVFQISVLSFKINELYFLLLRPCNNFVAFIFPNAKINVLQSWTLLQGILNYKNFKPGYFRRCQ